MAEKTKRSRSVIRSFRLESNPNELVTRSGNDVTHVIFRALDAEGKDEGEPITVDLAKMFGGTLPPASVGRAAAAFGISTSIGNAGNTSDETYEAMVDRFETLEAGEWTTERASSGPTTTLVLEALVEYRRRNGKETSDAEKASFRETLKNKEKRESYMRNEGFAAVYAELKVQRAVAAAAKAKEAAAGSETLDELLA